MKQILIVEDDSFLNKMVAYNLTADGYGVTSALNARTAADAIRHREFPAYSRSVFANGAINAAVYLAKKEPGLYNMGNMIAEL